MKILKILSILEIEPLSFKQIKLFTGITDSIYLNALLHYLQQNRMISKDGKRGQYLYYLTDRGRKYLAKYRISNIIDKVMK